MCLQGIIWPQVITGIVVNLLNALINYIVLFVLDLGVAWVSHFGSISIIIAAYVTWLIPHNKNTLCRGSAIANAVSVFSMAVILYAYILWKGLHKATWRGEFNICIGDSFPSCKRKSGLIGWIHWQQAGLKTACRTGAPTSTWPSPAWSWCVLNGGRMR